jgi:ferredoxin-type protein NapH
MKKRQKVRRAIAFVMFLLFPILLNYLSPYVIIDGAMAGVVSGSMLLFGLLFVGSLFLGRWWCAYLCPGAGMQESCTLFIEKKPKGGWRDIVKYVIWVIWIGLIAMFFISAGGILGLDPLRFTDHGVSVSGPMNYIIYYGVLSLVFLFSLIGGQHAFCRYLCWMAPFMVIGRKLSVALHLPGPRLQADPDKCISCMRCEKACSMGLKVSSMVKEDRMENSECIHCLACVDVCPSKAVSFRYGVRRKKKEATVQGEKAAI